MGFLDRFKGSNNSTSKDSLGVIESGRNKNTGGHDHRSNKGDDRTPSQKKADRARRKD